MATGEYTTVTFGQYGEVYVWRTVVPIVEITPGTGGMAMLLEILKQQERSDGEA
ncbi:MAG: hypothetical protein ACWGQW_19475 [bacterium]